MARPSNPNARIKLLVAAEAVFVERGLDAAKVEDISARAGLGKGSFYLHFKSKEDAFRQLVEAMVARMQSHLDAIPLDSCQAVDGPLDLAQFLERWVEQDVPIFEFVWQNRGLMALLMAGGGSASFRHLVDAFADHAAGKVRVFLERGIALGLYRADLDLDVTSAFVAGAYDRLARQFIQQKTRPDIRLMLRKSQMLFLRGIASASLLEGLDQLSARPIVKPRSTRRKAVSPTTRTAHRRVRS